jgi:hypothetical protein
MLPAGILLPRSGLLGGMFLGLDSSTQSLSALVIDPASGAIVKEVSVNFGSAFPSYGSPSGFIPGGQDGEVHADPRMWLEALDLVFAKLKEGFDLSRIKAVACSGQQHGSVYFNDTIEERLATLDPARALVEQIPAALTRATAPIWMDTSTGAECAEIAAAAGGNPEVCRISGSVAIERFTGPQIRRFYKQQPEAYGMTAVIHLVSSFVGSVLAGKSIAIDHGDGAGMNLLNLEKPRPPVCGRSCRRLPPPPAWPARFRAILSRSMACLQTVRWCSPPGIILLRWSAWVRPLPAPSSFRSALRTPSSRRWKSRSPIRRASATFSATRRAASCR